jgi:hypothetical protein
MAATHRGRIQSGQSTTAAIAQPHAKSRVPYRAATASLPHARRQQPCAYHSHMAPHQEQADARESPNTPIPPRGGLQPKNNPNIKPQEGAGQRHALAHRPERPRTITQPPHIPELSAASRGSTTKCRDTPVPPDQSNQYSSPRHLAPTPRNHRPRERRHCHAKPQASQSPPRALQARSLP